jgi:type II secretory ATPase GspE/PulE/Tfp pilus assembly ATPase PilB-like protein
MQDQDPVRITEEQSTLRRARVLNLPYFDTSALQEKTLFTELLTKEELYSLKVIPLKANAHYIHFGITTTTSQQTMQSLRQRFLDQRVEYSIISDSGYRDYMKLYDPPKQIVYQDVALTVEADANKFQEITSILDQVKSDDILAYLVQQSFRLKASDIHLECQKQALRIRFRVDGVLHPIAQLSYDKYRQLLSSIAVAANVSTGSPDAQTGHINKTYKMQNGELVTVNLRVETVPTVYGVDVVMRLFNMKVELFNIDNLGLSPKERSAVDDVIKHPTGLVLVVGPTGSGKTTTLYSLINTLNTPERKIITLEDPVEYFIEGVVQIPVSGDKNQTGFAEKLRAVLRLDPDVVMLGEIRDEDTAKTALQAALTGHLVLSTFHASSAAAALTRMLDAIGINPLFSSAMHLVMAQRLVRRLDDKTKQPYKPDESLKAQLRVVIDSLPEGVDRPNLDEVTLYKAGFSDENPFGYSGQIAIREQLHMTTKVQEILKLPPNKITTNSLQEAAISDGMVTMLQDGVLKAISGLTTIEEVYRVVV